MKKITMIVHIAIRKYSRGPKTEPTLIVMFVASVTASLAPEVADITAGATPFAAKTASSVVCLTELTKKSVLL